MTEERQPTTRDLGGGDRQGLPHRRLRARRSRSPNERPPELPERWRLTAPAGERQRPVHDALAGDASELIDAARDWFEPADALVRSCDARR